MEVAFAACGIGSLPYGDPQRAIQLIKKCLPEIPHWPQLPRRGRKEHFVNQFLASLGRFGLLKYDPHSETSWFDADSEGFITGLASFYSAYLALCEGERDVLEEFRIPEDGGAGFYAFIKELENGGFPEARYLKGQVAGPLSVGLNLNDAVGRPAYYDHQLRDVVVKALACQAHWQVDRLRKFGLPVFMFVDDPAVEAYGSFYYLTLRREDIVSDLGFMVETIKRAGGIPGAHSCAGVDWSIFVEAGFEVISFDAYGYLESLFPYRSELDRFLEGGGILAWGIVPSRSEAYGETKESLRERLDNGIEKLAVDKDRLRRQSLITPSCGTGLLDPDLAERIYYLTGELSSELRKGGGC